MADFLAVVQSRDSSPNYGDDKPRPLARCFEFKTNMSLPDLMAASAVRSSEFTNVAAGEDVTIYGPGYIRTFTVVSKSGEFVTLQRMGTEDGPDRTVANIATIPSGEVGVDVRPDLGGIEYDPNRMSVTLLDCDVPFEISHNADGFSVDIETACLQDVTVLWQVYP